jgi:hypothetical protein
MTTRQGNSTHFEPAAIAVGDAVLPLHFARVARHRVIPEAVVWEISFDWLFSLQKKERFYVAFLREKK